MADADPPFTATGLVWPPGVERVAGYLREAGAEARIEELATDAGTAEQAADAVGCTLGQVVKSLVLLADGRPVVALVPGDERADVGAAARRLDAGRAVIARPDEVRAITGFRPGAVAPFPLPAAASVLVQRSLLRHEVLWAGAGSARHLVRLTPGELVRLTRGVVEDIVLESA
ncbi:MAG: YbaK/EbsC family protein [Gaiella sp.]